MADPWRSPRVLRRRARAGASEVLSTILMVAVTIVLVGVLFFMLNGTGTPPNETSTLVFQVGEPTRNATNASRNDTVFTVQAKLGNGDIVWNDSSLQVYVFDANATLMMAHNLTIQDQNANGRADAGDRIVVRGWTNAYHGLHLSVNYRNRIVGDALFP